MTLRFREKLMKKRIESPEQHHVHLDPLLCFREKLMKKRIEREEYQWETFEDGAHGFREKLMKKRIERYPNASTASS